MFGWREGGFSGQTFILIALWFAEQSSHEYYQIKIRQGDKSKEQRLGIGFDRKLFRGMAKFYLLCNKIGSIKSGRVRWQANEQCNRQSQTDK